MENLQNILAIHKHNYNKTPALSETTNKLKLFDRLQFDFEFPDQEIITLSESTLDHLKNTPKFLRDWQADDMRTNTVGGYFKNPVGEAANLVFSYIEEIIKLIVHTEIDEETNEEVEVVIKGMEEFIEEIKKAKAVAGQFTDHTNRLSNVVPVYPNPKRPHYLTCMAVNRVLEYIIYQTDDKKDTETILSCFTALFTNATIAEFAIEYEAIVKLIKSHISFTTRPGPDGELKNIYIITLTQAELREIIKFIKTSDAFMESRVQHDYRVWENIQKLMNEYNQFKAIQTIGETQKKLIKNYIGSDKLLASLELNDVTPTKYAVNIDYYGETEYTIVPEETVLPPNTAITILDDYINYYNVANLEIILLPPNTEYKLDVNPGALLFDTVNGVWSNNRTISISNTGNGSYSFSNISFSDFKSSEFRYELNPANTRTISPGNTTQLIVSARGMTTGNTIDYGTISITPGVKIQTRVNSNNNIIIPSGILFPSQIVTRFGSNTDQLIINANNGPYPIYGNTSDEYFQYTWKNESEYPVTISTIENITDSANLTNMDVTIYYSANTEETINVANGFTLNTAESILWYANVAPHIDSPNSAIYKISTTDGQERLIYLGVYGGDNGSPPGDDGLPEEPPGGGIDDSSLYNETLNTNPDIIVTSSNFDLIISAGKPKTQITYSGPDISGSAYLNANGMFTIEDLNISANGYYTYSVDFAHTKHRRNITKAIFSS